MVAGVVFFGSAAVMVLLVALAYYENIMTRRP
jgi:hypothetical protein